MSDAIINVRALISKQNKVDKMTVCLNKLNCCSYLITFVFKQNLAIS
jgi:hypothetical protein